MPNAHWPDCSSEQLRQSVLFTNYVIKYNKLYNYSKHQIKINLFYNKTLFIILNIKICHNLQGVFREYIYFFISPHGVQFRYSNTKKSYNT